MPVVRLNGIRLSYEVTGSGELAVLVLGTGSPGRVWRLHQVPALVAAGYRVVTFDNRGIPPSEECAAGMTTDDLVGDTAVGTSYAPVMALRNLSPRTRIRVPALVIGFADYGIVPPYLAREVADAISGACYDEVDGCGHHGCLERPDTVNELILTFFAANHTNCPDAVTDRCTLTRLGESQ